MSSTRTFGDAERHLVQLCRELAERGHEVFVALRPTSEWQSAVDFLSAANVLHISVRNSFGMFSARQIAHFVGERGINIVHAHAAKDYIAGSMIRRAADDVRLVLTRHVERPLKPFHRFALRNVDAAIALSPLIRQQLEFSFPRAKLYTIPKGIYVQDPVSTDHNDERREFRDFHGIPFDVPLVASVGELKVAGGQRDLILAANEILKKLPTCHFVVAGSDRSAGQKFRRELKRLVKVLGIDKNVIWLEQADDSADVIAAADVLVSTSHTRDITPSTIEAMAAGKVVVTTAANEIIMPTAIVEPKDPVALAAAVIAFLLDDDLRRDAGQGAKAVVREKFSLERMVNETEELYRRVLARSASVPLP